ncbi:MAG TPA: S-layer homology domain-containing protein [Candidatus Avoscillospira stercoripullorum]|uniref:S-layer homology domain-containing protein n=1 Tax=Candidatus Avoscillospira stercoripullorum TaxID=2840709 RepID=A0A9D1A6H4_9FIRM|nr:S-layer homology domain-containing protein [Candidatus Avoscillospira stercoripullorum]
MRRIKRWLCGGMCLLLLLGLLPAAAQAEEGTAAWAGEAVETLCKIYGSDLGVSDSLEPMTKAQAAAVFTYMGNTAVAATLTGQGNLTRGEACTALTQAFAIPTGEKAAILYLYERNIINGKSAGELDENGTVSCADFAVLTYRVLNFVGGGLGSIVEQLKPGTEAYFAWMYLAARRCVAFQSNQLETSMNSVSDFSTYDGIDETEYTDGSTVVEVETALKSGEEIWDAWVAALSEPKIGGLDDFDKELEETYRGNETMKAAATRLMGAFISAYTVQYGSAPTIFTDVTMEDWWYDGVMYSFDAGYISGLGNGTFEPNYRLPLYEFAVLLYRINPVDASELENITLPFLENGDFSEYEQAVMGNPSVQNAMKAAIKEGYFSWADGEDEDFDPTATAARKDAISDILKACAAGKGVELDLDSVNPSVLDRFENTNGLEDTQKRYLAYAVSCGMVNGTSATKLSPDEPVSRADAGVLLYRMLIGLDESKMHDYEQNIQNALD